MVLTGAGISAESGVPTFRDAQTGFWANHRPEDLATPEAFRRNPTMVWEWYAMRRERVAAVQPNPGHHALVDLERHAPSFTLVTQNVDGLHQRAGSRSVIELHGNIGRVKCADDDQVVESWSDAGEAHPRCPRCNGLLRPDVVWFGEMLPQHAFNAAEAASAACDLFLSIGTSTVVHPAAGLPFLARLSCARIIEVNPEVTPLTREATWVLGGRAGVVLPQLIAAAWP